jgi:type IV pilus assembly protein PilC
MALFEYKGVEDNKFCAGEIDAISKEEAIYKLKKERIIVIEITETNEQQLFFSKLKGSYSLFDKKIKNKTILVFTKKFATMVKSGLSITDSLNILKDQAENKSFEKIIEEIHKKIEEGNSIAETFSNYPKLFDNIYINMIKAGEISGKLDFFLEKIVDNLSKVEKLKSQIKSALFYPATLFLVAIAVIIIMFTKVVPIFQEMYGNMSVALPGPTQIIINISDVMRDGYIMGIAVSSLTFVILAIYYIIRKNYKARLWFHNLMLKIPLLGELILKSSLSKIALVLNSLESAGVSLVEALDIASNSINNIVLQNIVADVRRDVFSGNNLSESFEKHEKIPGVFYGMLRVGEKTGNIEHMLESVSDYYNEEVEETVKRVMSLLEPIMIVFLGIVIGFIIVAMYMPMFNMGSLVKQ